MLNVTNSLHDFLNDLLFNYWTEENQEYYFNLSFDEALKDFNENGYESACELIRRESIRAYRAEEASIGNI